jgi:SH3-like domain-containing protein
MLINQHLYLNLFQCASKKISKLTIFRFVSLKQKKVNLIPSDSEGLFVQQYAEKYGKPSYEITIDDLTSLESSLKNDFFVGVF